MNEMTMEQKKLIIQVILGLSYLVTVINGIISHAFTLQELALFIGALLGIGIKVFIPFIRKLYEGKLDEFGIKYLWMMALTFLYNIPIVFVLLNQLDWTGIGIGFTLFIAITIGLGTQWVTEEAYRIAKNQTGQFKTLGTILAVVAELTSTNDAVDETSKDEPDTSIGGDLSVQPDTPTEDEPKSDVDILPKPHDFDV